MEDRGCCYYPVEDAIRGKAPPNVVVDASTCRLLLLLGYIEKTFSRSGKEVLGL